MNLLENLLSAGDGGVVKQLAGQFGVTTEQATSAVSSLVPALAGGIKEKLASAEGSPSELSKLIMSGNLTRFADDPKSLASPSTVEQGKSLLNMVFGGGDLTSLTSAAAEKTGVSSGVISRMAPIVMSLLAGFLSKNVASGNSSLTDLVGSIAGGGGIFAAVKGLAHKITG
jgi:hypothetical protein